MLKTKKKRNKQKGKQFFFMIKKSIGQRVNLGITVHFGSGSAKSDSDGQGKPRESLSDCIFANV